MSAHASGFGPAKLAGWTAAIALCVVIIGLLVGIAIPWMWRQYNQAIHGNPEEVREAARQKIYSDASARAKNNYLTVTSKTSDGNETLRAGETWLAEDDKAKRVSNGGTIGCQWTHPHWENNSLTLTVPENCGGGWSLVTQSSANGGLTLTLGPWTKGALMGAPELQDQYGAAIVLAFRDENWHATIPPRTDIFVRPIEGATIKIIKEEK